MKLVHLVYIHGFQGNDTTFQSFPTDLQQYLSSHIPKHLDVTIQTSLYPTYKSVKPISVATNNFLEWLSTQPPGPVILLGHSMGGLLAADAATHSSNNPDQYPGAKPHRIAGMVAFDTPYLGMHPHVVVSGIASLFPNDDGEKKKTDSEMNDTSKVNIVDGKVTDDWNSYKRDTTDGLRPTSIASTSQSNPQLPSPTSSPSILSSMQSRSPLPFVDRTISFLSSHAEDPLVKWARKHADDPFSASKRWVVEHFQFGSCMFDPSGLKGRYSRLVGWQGGLWVNYWTETLPKPSSAGDADPAVGELMEKDGVADNDAALHDVGIAAEVEAPRESVSSTPAEVLPLSPSSLPIYGAPTKSEADTASKAERQAVKALEKERKQAEKSREKALKKEQKVREAEAKKARKAELEKNKVTPGRHFIVLPTGLGQVLGGGERWEKVLIGGVQDEVAAHCGLFIRGQNLDYDGLVDRVGKKVLGWCEAF